ncbi:FUSC family protein [Phenylobacterium sp.]|uniref:FUSC family protein n=1 Tax=Phenylobacterium sp. TaxID=1871053 RepID=UPI0035B2A776
MAIFSAKAFAASMAALYVALAMGLPKPYWAMTTAYIVSQPLAGAVRSKALFRLVGTSLGAAAAVILTPALAQAPPLLCLALALWVGGCLALSLLDRTPRSYVLMLAGYTAAIIGFPSVDQPQAIFDVAVARVVEIGLGIICATAVHSLVFPEPIGPAIRARLASWLAEADRWALDVLAPGERGDFERDRRHLAAAASEIGILSTHLSFDTSRLRETTGVVRALHERMLLLIPLLSGLADRMKALAQTSDHEARRLIDETTAWIAAGSPRQDGLDLLDRLNALIAARDATTWDEMLAESLLVRLGDAIVVLGESHALMQRLNDPDAPLSPPLEAAASNRPRPRLHTDLPMAMLSGLAAAISILLACTFWIATGWPAGASAAVLAAVICCLFAAQDDPTASIGSFGIGTVLSVPLIVVYAVAVLPAANGFPMLVAALAPALLILGALMAHPRFGAAATAMLLGMCNGMALQETYNPDFATVVNVNLGQFVGMFSAVFVIGAIRAVGADVAARRLMTRTWRGLARIARARAAPTPVEFAALMVDRVGQLAQRLAGVERDNDLTAVDTLRDLRVGMNLVAVQSLRPQTSGAIRASVESLLSGVADHFDGLAQQGAARQAPAAVLAHLDAALNGVRAAGSSALAVGASGLVGLRRNLFPDAPAFVSETTR